MFNNNALLLGIPLVSEVMENIMAILSFEPFSQMFLTRNFTDTLFSTDFSRDNML